MQRARVVCDVIIIVGRSAVLFSAADALPASIARRLIAGLLRADRY